MSFACPSLPVSQESRVVTLKYLVYQVFCLLIYVFLRLCVEHMVKMIHFVFK
jgi:hypothetical protein